MGVTLLSIKQTFVSAMNNLSATIAAQFIVWLDEKVAEYKVNGNMNFDLTQEAPKWIKDYSMAILLDSGSVQNDIIDTEQATEQRHVTNPESPRFKHPDLYQELRNRKRVQNSHAVIGLENDQSDSAETDIHSAPKAEVVPHADDIRQERTELPNFSQLFSRSIIPARLKYQRKSGPRFYSRAIDANSRIQAVLESDDYSDGDSSDIVFPLPVSDVVRDVIGLPLQTHDADEQNYSGTIDDNTSATSHDDESRLQNFNLTEYEEYRPNPEPDQLTEAVDVKPNVELIVPTVDGSRNNSSYMDDGNKSDERSLMRLISRHSPDEIDWPERDKRDIIDQASGSVLRSLVPSSTYLPSLSVTEHEKPTCHLCGETFSDYQALNDHHQINTCTVHAQAMTSSLTSFSCSICNKMFSHQISWMEHMKRHRGSFSPGRIICNMCKKQFSRKSYLFSHMASVHKTGQGPPFSCKKCGHGFYYQTNLRTHTQKSRCGQRVQIA